MKIVSFCPVACLLAFAVCWPLFAQDAKNPGASSEKPADRAAGPDADPKAYSGMYTFLRDDAGSVTGFISRFGDGESDNGAFLDQFLKAGKLVGSKLNFTTEVVHGIAFEFQGTVDRGEGKSPGDEAYYVLKGTLTENTSDANKKVTSRSRTVVLKMFPRDAAPAPAARK
jgi:hypothetical protein